jgi:hypothetical protein
VEPVDEAPDLSPGVAAAGDALDAEILRLLVPATLAVFLDPAMALIDTGAGAGPSGADEDVLCLAWRAHFVPVHMVAHEETWPEEGCMHACMQIMGIC